MTSASFPDTQMREGSYSLSATMEKGAEDISPSDAPMFHETHGQVIDGGGTSDLNRKAAIWNISFLIHGVYSVPSMPTRAILSRSQDYELPFVHPPRGGARGDGLEG